VDQSDEGREYKTRIIEQIGSAANPRQRDCAWLYRESAVWAAHCRSCSAVWIWSEQFRSGGELPLSGRARHSVLREDIGLRPLFWWRKAGCEH